MVISLGIHPSICFGEIFQSSDEIRCGNGVLTFGPKEFRNLVLLNSEVEIRGPVAACSASCSRNGSSGSGVTGVIVVSLEIEVTIIMVVIIAGVLGSQVDIITSSGGHFVCNKALISLF